MALCTINSSLHTKSTPFYIHPRSNDFRNICQLTLNKVLSIDSRNKFQFVERLARSLSVEGINPISTTARTYSRTISEFIQQFERQTQLEQDIQQDFDFQAIIEDDDQRHYSTKTAYECPSQEYILSTPPNSYKPICVQLLARHGSRTLNSHDYDIQTLKIWRLAKQRNMLTSVGKQLEEDVKLFMDENNRIGRGELTQTGKEEHFNLGNRLYNRLKPLFISSNTISIMTSGKKRAMDSANEFINGLKTNLYNFEILNNESNKDLLYFHKSCIDYIEFKKTNFDIHTKLHSIKYSKQTKIYAEQVLKKIYKDDFVKLLINGNYSFETDNQKNIVDIVLYLYLMFSTSPAQRELHLIKMLAKYFNQEESNWFAYINDAQEYYLKGPSVEGTSITSDMAKPLLIDFFSSVSACIESTNGISANLRFAHAETIIPFATLLQIPDLSDKATHSSDTYTYENNQWRGNTVAPMAANIQWEIYQQENNPNSILIRMLYNEKEIRFKETCQSITPDSFFYDFNELKRAYADLLSTSNSNVN